MKMMMIIILLKEFITAQVAAVTQSKGMTAMIQMMKFTLAQQNIVII